MPPRCFRCSGSASRCGRSTPCSSPTTPAMAPGPARCSTARRSASWSTASPSAACSARCDGVLSGYMGGADIGEAILYAVERVRAANPAAHYCCDPVIGDVGRGVFVRPGIPDFMRERAVPAADVVTPNQFELDFLSGRATATLTDALAATDAVHRLGPSVILVTSLITDDTPDGRHRPPGVRRQRPLAGAHAAARPLGQRGGRRHRRAVLLPLEAHRLGRARRWSRRRPRPMACCGAPSRPARARFSPWRRRTSSSTPSRLFEAEPIAGVTGISGERRGMSEPIVRHVDDVAFELIAADWPLARARRGRHRRPFRRGGASAAPSCGTAGCCCSATSLRRRAHQRTRVRDRLRQLPVVARAAAFPIRTCATCSAWRRCAAPTAASCSG